MARSITPAHSRNSFPHGADAEARGLQARDLLTNAHAAAAANGYANVERRAAEALQQLD